MIKLSIIIPVYNKEKYLDDCINSLLNIREFTYEIILVDDGSVDRSLSICNLYSEKYDHIISIAQKNQGVSAARNTGIANASGELITFIDADDFVGPTFGKQIISALETEADLYQFNYTRWFDEKHFSSGKLTLLDGFYSNTNAWTAQISGLEICAMCVWGALYKTSIIKENHITFRKGMRTCEDFLFNIQYISQVDNFYVSHADGYCYRSNPNSVTSKRALSHADDYEYIYHASLNYIMSHDATTDETDLFQERWIRWNIDLIFNWMLQKYDRKTIWNHVDTKEFYKAAIEVNRRLHSKARFEQWMLSKQYSGLIKLYIQAISQIKKVFGKYRL